MIKQSTPTYRLIRQSTLWWIEGLPDGLVGPYESKGEAERDRRGMERLERYGDRPGFVSSDKKAT